MKKECEKIPRCIGFEFTITNKGYLKNSLNKLRTSLSDIYYRGKCWSFIL